MFVVWSSFLLSYRQTERYQVCMICMWLFFCFIFFCRDNTMESGTMSATAMMVL